MISSRERVKLALNHQEPDRVPFDLGGSGVSGMHVSTVYRLRQALNLDPPGTPVKVIRSYQMLGEIKPDLMEMLGADVVCLEGCNTEFGFKKEGWKPWSTFDGTPVLVPSEFNTDPEPNGDILMYPQGDKLAPPSGRMPKGGWYFDAIIRQPPIDDKNLNVADNLEEFGSLSEETLNYFQHEADRLYRDTDKAIMGNFGGTSFGDVGQIPAVALKYPKGIRDIQEWYISLINRQDYVREVFDQQSKIALANLAKVYDRVGDRIDVVFISGADFGMQNGPLISPETYRNLFKPFHRRVNDWVHEHTAWKTFIHSCGSVMTFIEDFIEAGFDILNPVQCSAVDMNLKVLKASFGDRITFWGGGVDTQKTLPFGTPEDVRREVCERIKILGPGGGFVLNTIHNIQALVPVENLLAMFETVRDFSRYSQD